MKIGIYFLPFGFCFIFGVSGLLPANWDRCKEQMHLLKNKIDTMGRVARLRDKMTEVGIHAYIVPSDNFHLSAVVAEHDKRLEYISGYNSSRGTAVVTMQYAALWVDKDQIDTAEDQIGCGWLLGNKGDDEVTSISQWLGNALPKTATTRVGGCPYFFRYDVWIGYATRLSYEDIALVGYTPDLVDLIWTVSRPQMPSTTLNPLPLKYSGKTWQDKINGIHKEMARNAADLLILTALDEASWVLNLRASEYDEMSSNTYFYSLAVLDTRRNKTKLYVKDHWQKLLDPIIDPESQKTLSAHLNTGHDGSCRWIKNSCVEVKEYNYAKFVRDVREMSSASSVGTVWLSYNTNHAIFSAVPQQKLFVAKSPVAKMKLIKNPTEVNGMKNAHIRDSVAVIRFLTKLEMEVEAGINWTLHMAAEKLKLYRGMQDHFRDTGWLGRRNILDKLQPAISRSGYFSINSPGYYIDGIAAIGRMLLFRQPTVFDKEIYTKTLMGLIDLHLAKWNKGVYGRELEVLARRPLLELNSSQRNGSSVIQTPFLQEHGGSIAESSKHPLFQWDIPLEENMFFSIEPGVKLEDQTQLTLKNIVYVKKVRTQFTLEGVEMLGFETVSFFPFEPHLINLNLLSKYQKLWLEAYNLNCRTKLGAILKEQGLIQEYDWLINRTRPITDDHVTISSSAVPLHSLLYLYTFFPFIALKAT